MSVSIEGQGSPQSRRDSGHGGRRGPNFKSRQVEADLSLKRWQIAIIASLVIAGLFFADGGAIYITQLMNRPPGTYTTQQQDYTTQSINGPPKAAFSYRTPARTLKYIAPTDRDTIVFLNNSTDPDGDVLTFRWYVRYNGTGNWKSVSASRDYWSRLPAGNHTVRLTVSDGMMESATEHKIVVERSQIYSSSRFPLAIKGIVYQTGRHFTGYYGTPPSEDEMVESLTVIHEELGCNAVALVGDYDDVTIRAAEIAIEMKFSMILLDPYYQRSAPNKKTHIDEFVEKIVSFSARAEELRKRAPESVVMSVGNELTNRYEGVTYENINSYLRKIIDQIRERFKGRLAYLTAGQQAEKFGVDWSGLGIDIMAPHLYYATAYGDASELIDQILRLSNVGKPLISSEFGCATFKGASLYGGNADAHEGLEIYDSDEQARNVFETIEIYEQSGKLQGAFLYVFMQRFMPEEKARAMGILEHNGPDGQNSRKTAFYAYKSYLLEQGSSPTSGVASSHFGEIAYSFTVSTGNVQYRSNVNWNIIGQTPIAQILVGCFCIASGWRRSGLGSSPNLE